MTRRDALVGLVASTVVLPGCNPIPTSCRVRLTLTITTAEGRRTGSSVFEISAREQLPIGVSQFIISVRGEAVVVPVGTDVVFGVPRYPAKALIDASLPELLPDGSGEEWRWDRLISRVRAKAGAEPSFDIPEEDWPSLVRFADRNRPESILPVCLYERVEREKRERGEVRGCAVRIVRATATPTFDPVTERIERYLPWVRTRGGSMVQDRSPVSSRSPEQNYNSTNFLSRN